MYKTNMIILKIKLFFFLIAMLLVYLLTTCTENRNPLEQDKDSSPTWQLGDSLVDTRDGKKYATVVIGSQCWMAENLNIGIYKASQYDRTIHSDVSNNGIIEKYAYDNDTTYSTAYGGLYDWNEAMDYSITEGTQGICPNGWHIPTDADWKTLEMALGMSSVDTDRSNWRGTDQGTQLLEGGSSGFHALFSSYRRNDGRFGTSSYMSFWSSSQYDATYKWRRSLSSDNTGVYRSYTYSTYGYCVRCVKDSSAAPKIILDKSILSPTCEFGSNAVASGFSIWNQQTVELNYTISDDATWLSCSPSEGSSTDERDSITVNYNTAGLAEGSYTATITVDCEEATNSPQAIRVVLTVFTEPHVGLSTISLSPVCSLGVNALSDTFEIWNAGTGILNYSIRDNVMWLYCNPSYSSSRGEYDAIIVTYNTAGLGRGIHTAIIDVICDNANNSTIEVSLSVLDVGFNYGSLTDSRDGQLYKTITIGSQTWMAENLNVGVYKASVNTGSIHSDVSNNSIIEKYVYNNDTTNFATYGGLYDWNEAMDYNTTEGAQGICPDGWHIPTDTEWKTLEMSLGMSSSDANSIGWRGTDQGTQLMEHGSSGFRALLAGHRAYRGAFYEMNSSAFFWSSTQDDAGRAWNRRLFSSITEVYRGINGNDKSYGFCVRCVKD